MTGDSWFTHANCAGLHGHGFYPERGGDTIYAKRICQACTVRAECLDYALDHYEIFGIWGGTSERERRGIRRRMKQVAS